MLEGCSHKPRGVELITCQHVSGGSKQTLASSDGMDILFWTLDQQDGGKPLGVWEFTTEANMVAKGGLALPGSLLQQDQLPGGWMV